MVGTELTPPPVRGVRYLRHLPELRVPQVPESKSPSRGLARMRPRLTGYPPSVRGGYPYELINKLTTRARARLAPKGVRA